MTVTPAGAVTASTTPATSTPTSSATATATGSATAAATAAATTDKCSAVHLIAVQDVEDSGTSGGFLAEVARPVLMAANGESTFDTAAAGSATQSAEAGASNDSWKPKDSWSSIGASAPATSAAATAALGANSTGQSASWKPNTDWTNGTASTTSATTSATATSATATATTSAPATTSATAGATTSAPVTEQGKKDVGHTVIQVANTNDERAFLPGVTGKEDIPEYSGSVSQAVEEAETSMADIAAECPDTRFIVMGVGQGAQVASTVAENIGAGNGIDADKLAGVVLFADPSRSESQPVVASGAEAPKGAQSETFAAPAAQGAGIATVTGQASNAGNFGAVADRTVSWCLDGDASCGLKADTPLAKLVANTDKGTREKAPEEQLAHVTDILAPAVMLAGVESLAEDVELGDDGFSFKRAASTDDTLIGRIAADSDREIPQSEMQERLLASGAQIGGMALAAGVTVAKDVITPANIAQIAAASAVSPAAGAGAALLLTSASAMKLVSPETMSTAALRLTDEAEAAGIDDTGLAEAAVQAAAGSGVSKHSYATTPVTASGETPTQATSGWMLDIVSESVGRELSDPATVSAAQAYSGGDVSAIISALSNA